MADLNLRLNRDVLTIAASARETLAHAGLDLSKSGTITLAIEPEVVEDAILEDVRSGAQCVVANVINFAPASLRQTNSLKDAEALAKISVNMLAGQRIQHPLIRVSPCGLPIDSSLALSLKEHCEQYKFVAELFDSLAIDGFLLDEFENEAELACALQGIRQGSQKTIVYFKDNIENAQLSDDDFAPASSKLAIFDYNECAHIDDLLDRATLATQSGIQFLLVKNAGASKSAAIAALTSGLPVS